MLTRRDEIHSSASEQPCGNGSGLRSKTSGSNPDLPLILCVLGQGPHYYLLSVWTGGLFSLSCYNTMAFEGINA